MRGFPAVAATRCAACTTSPHRGFGQAENLVSELALLWRGADFTCREPTKTVGARPGPGTHHLRQVGLLQRHVATRLRRIQLGGGVDTGRTVNDSCFVVNSRSNC